jgi:hypothetical protein
MHRTKINFAKNYQKDSYNKSHLMGKNLRGLRPINHIIKTLIP